MAFLCRRVLFIMHETIDVMVVNTHRFTLPRWIYATIRKHRCEAYVGNLENHWIQYFLHALRMALIWFVHAFKHMPQQQWIFNSPFAGVSIRFNYWTTWNPKSISEKNLNYYIKLNCTLYKPVRAFKSQGMVNAKSKRKNHRERFRFFALSHSLGFVLFYFFQPLLSLWYCQYVPLYENNNRTYAMVSLVMILAMALYLFLCNSGVGNQFSSFIALLVHGFFCQRNESSNGIGLKLWEWNVDKVTTVMFELTIFVIKRWNICNRLMKMRKKKSWVHTNFIQAFPMSKT